MQLFVQQEREAAIYARKQKTYALLDADDGDDDFGGGDGGGNGGGVSSEEERLRDQREREELEKHIRERATASTRKLTDQKLTKREEEEAIRRSDVSERDGLDTLSEVPLLIDSICRKVSRQEYLKKREQKKFEELRNEIEDEQYLFDGVKLTEAEYRELRYKKQIYELVKKRLEDVDDLNEYRMPEAYDQEGGVNQEKRFVVALQRYSIDALLERTKHMLFLQSVTKQADKLKPTGELKIVSKEGGVLLKDNFEGVATWAFEVDSQSMVCPIVVEDLNPPRQMLVDVMLCEESGFFLEIADLIKGLGLTILRGVMEAQNDKIWARFAVEVSFEN
ncbi:hypothetical protein K2173_015139 [Erythroxylum novogranatense]|uniref:BHLH domain-containing protein n=1 Tax=Erythroxylum novogranatense TaxID=1862640 RepID=A0AAV8T1C0_9ROSI|nr:hypothetical protein K2173_015139 [Erythroxylum novogranatense]